MTRRAILAAAAAAVRARAAEPNTLTDAERGGGWRLLFDGKTTGGWIEVTGKAFPSNCWTIEDGALKAIVRRDGMQDIRTVETFASFDLTFEWKLLANGNSGVKYLIQRVDEWTNAAGRQARARGLEYQLAGDANPDAASDPRRAAGSLYGAVAPSPRVSPRIGEFNASRILLSGGRVEHWLNGVRVAAFDTGSLPDFKPVLRSPVCLQNHSSETWFRNLKLRPL
jgi:hypothetical protein